MTDLDNEQIDELESLVRLVVTGEKPQDTEEPLWYETEASHIFEPQNADIGCYGWFKAYLDDFRAQIAVYVGTDHCQAIIEIGPSGEYRGSLWMDQDGIATNKGDAQLADPIQLEPIRRLAGLGKAGRLAGLQTLAMMHSAPIIEPYNAEYHWRHWPSGLV